MSAATASRPVALLRSFLLLAGLLAVILGLLGMHVLAGSHSAHAQAAPSGSGVTSKVSHSDAQVHDGHTVSAPAAPASAGIGGTEVPPSCICQGGCAEKPAMHPRCTPSPAGATLSAPQPEGTLLGGEFWTAVRADLTAGYTYLPGTPTPSELTISRT